MSLVKLVVRTPKKFAQIVSFALFEAGAGGVEELDGARQLVVYAATRQDAERMAARARELLLEAAPEASGIALAVEVDESSNWASAWTEHLRQVALTPSLVIQPLWDHTPLPPGAQRILFDPKLSFGDGAHATTRLASLALERACRAKPGVRLLDFGSGTGVLSFVALLSGASATCGVDIDPVSVEAAEQNAVLNGLAERAEFSLPGEPNAGTFQLVVANLEAPTLLAVAPDIMRRSEGAQRLILTGFLEARVPEVAAAFASMFKVELADREQDWALLELVPG